MILTLKSNKQLIVGKKVESEHDNVYNIIEKFLSFKKIKMPFSKEQFRSLIAKAHIFEDKDYYTKLINRVEDFKATNNEKKLIDFIVSKNGKINDKKDFHNFAEKNNINVHKAEEIIYGIIYKLFKKEI